jgi:hypothetical protein
MIGGMTAQARVFAPEAVPATLPAALPAAPPATLPTAPPDRPAEPSPALTLLAIAGTAMLGLCLVVQLVVELLWLASTGPEGVVLTGVPVDPIVGWAERFESLQGPLYLAWVAAYLGVAAWMSHALRVQRERLGGRAPHPIWAWLAFPVPLVNVVAPIVLVARLCTPPTPVRARVGRTLAPLAAVFAPVWLVASYLGAVGFSEPPRLGDGVELYVSDTRGVARLALLITGAELVMAVLVLLVVVLVARRQRRLTALQAAPQGHAAEQRPWLGDLATAR